MRTSSLCSVQVPGVWVPWLWAYRGEISFYWLSSGAAQLCIWFYIPYQVIFQDYFWIKTPPSVPKINNSKCILNQKTSTKQTKKPTKHQKILWGVFCVFCLFLVGVDSEMTMKPFMYTIYFVFLTWTLNLVYCY